MSRENANLSLKRRLEGKTLGVIEMMGHHGDELWLYFTDGTRLQICTYAGTVHEKEHGKDDLYVAIDRVEVTGNLPEFTCSCKKADAWRCAVEQSLSTVSCSCSCHH